MGGDLDSGLVRILGPDGTSVGAGFVITDDGLIATCAHVVHEAGAGPGTTVTLGFRAMRGERQAEVLPGSWTDPDAQDVAILRATAPLPSEVRALSLGMSARAEGRIFYTFGYPAAKPDDGLPGKCEVVGYTKENGYTVLSLRSDEVSYGFSGAPLWDSDQQVVTGMITSIVGTRPIKLRDAREPLHVPFDRSGRQTTTAFAAIVETIRTIVPSLTQISICPYRGLLAFREEDASVFFGREAVTDRLVTAARDHPIVAVIGNSGSGKSSVVFAGLAPALRQGGRWQIASFRPGSCPMKALAGALSQLLDPDLSETERLPKAVNLAEDINHGRLLLADVTERLRTIHESQAGLLLIADQFEETYTLCQDDKERRQFVDALLAAIAPAARVDAPPIKVVLTLRADFLGRALAYEPLVAALQERQVLLGPMKREELRAAIEQPAVQHHVRVADGLTDRILDAIGDEPGNLPLLEFALSELWQRQDHGRLTHAAYEEIGGAKQALAKHAESVYARLSSERQRLAHRILVQLVRPGDYSEDTRRLATRADMPGSDAWELVTWLATKRLVVTGRDPVTDRETVEVAHEELIRGWQRLREWVDDDRTFRIWQEQLRSDIQRWESRDHDDGALLRGALLIEAQEWLATRSEDLADAEREYITTSTDVLEQTERRTRGVRSRYLAAEASAQVQTNVPLALLLSVEALHEADTVEARSCLLTSLLTPSQPLGEPQVGHTDEVWSVAFSPDGAVLASGSDDHTVRLWDVAGRQPLGEPLVGHTDTVGSVAFSPDGTTLASGGDDRTVRLWDVASRQPLGEPLGGYTGWVNSVTFSPDGAILASGGGDKTVRLWDVDYASWQTRACVRANRNLTWSEWQRYWGNEPYHRTCPDLPPGRGVIVATHETDGAMAASSAST